MRPRATGVDLLNSLLVKAREHRMDQAMFARFANDAFDALEAMVADGWVRATFDPDLPVMQAPAEAYDSVIRKNPSVEVTFTGSGRF